MPLLFRDARFQMHFSIFLFGFTGILGELISIPTYWLVWWRLGLAAVGFGILLGTVRARGMRWLAWRQMPALAGVGVVLGLHWAFFFGSIAAANVSIAVVMLATSPFMASLIEPMVRNRRILPHELALGVLALVGIYLIHQVSLEYWLGMALGLASAATSALYGILNKGLVDKHSALQLNFYEMSGAWIVLGLLSPLLAGLLPGGADFAVPQGLDWLWLLILSLLCTNFAYLLSIYALRQVPVFNYILAVNLEPIYTIILAWLFLGEAHVLDTQFFIGTVLVIGSVFVSPVLHRLTRKRGAAGEAQ